ncbi:glucosamine-6-phosphate deaminase [Brevibacillus fulvus]|nr:glucosamine-6-phosphate deaminase [Brevibacillus fulvus]
MQINVMKDYQDLSRKAADCVAQQIKRRANSVIGFATGGTPVGMYAELIRMHQQEGLDFQQVTSFNLDEYVGLSTDHPQSYYHFMWERLFSQINILPENIHVPPGIFDDAEAVCRQYEAQIEQAGGIDLQILGIGQNGHIGFNEPRDTFTVSTHITELAEKTRKANARFFSSEAEVPHRAITMGIGSIMKARSILLLASGRSKAEAVKQIFSGRVDPHIPASVLQLHPHVMLILDEEAASLIVDQVPSGR